MKTALAATSVVATLLLLAGCAESMGLKTPEPRLVGQTASFEGCGFRVTFAGGVKRTGFAAAGLDQDYASSVKKSAVLDEAGFEADGETRELTFCRCMRYSVESTASREEATQALRGSFRELREAGAAPIGWQDGTPLGRAARFEFSLKDGRRVIAGTNFSGNCVGAVAAIGGSEAAARRFVDSRAPL